MSASSPALRDIVAAKLRRAGHTTATAADAAAADDTTADPPPGPAEHPASGRPADAPPPPVVVAAADTVARALACCPAGHRADGGRLLVLANSFDPAHVLRAWRAGVHTLLPVSCEPAQLAAAVRATHHGEGRMPAPVLLRLLTGVTGVDRQPGTSRQPGAPALTPRQTAVLALIADGLPNEAIAAALSCSEHTVKNVIYDLMARLQVRNRAHAVAEAVRAGLI